MDKALISKINQIQQEHLLPGKCFNVSEFIICYTNLLLFHYDKNNSNATVTT